MSHSKFSITIGCKKTHKVDPEDTEGSSTLVELSISCSVFESLGIAQERRCSISKSGSFTESSPSSFKVELEEFDEDVLSVS